MPERLRRLGNLYQRWPVYFVTACTSERRPLLASDEVHTALKAYGSTGPEFGAWLGSYIILPDHLDLFVVIDDREISLSRWVKGLKGTVSASLRVKGEARPYWQKGFFDHVLRGGESYAAKWHYVRDNAVRAGLVQKWEDWPYTGDVYPLEYRRE